MKNEQLNWCNANVWKSKVAEKVNLVEESEENEKRVL